MPGGRNNHRGDARPRSVGEGGFTLVELLVVVLLIGILAAIAIPVFLGQTPKARDAAAKSNARNVVSLVEACHAGSSDYAACDTVAELGSDGVPLVDGVPGNGEVAVLDATGTTYEIAAVAQTGHEFKAMRAAGSLSRTCTPAGEGGCRPGGSW